MIIELVGQPASGKSFLVNSLCSDQRANRVFLVDYQYNKKSKIKKMLFIIKHLPSLGHTYMRCRKMIKQALVNEKPKKKKFFLRQFRLDYILTRYATKLSRKGYSCFFSENFHNLFSYIFFYRKTEKKSELFSQLINIFPEELIRRDYIIQIKVEAETNLCFKSSRAGKDKKQFAEETDFYNDFSLVEKAQIESMKLLKKYTNKTICFENYYNDSSSNDFITLINDLI